MSIYLSTFPSTSAIPPACFYNMGGLAGWLNQNPSYKQYFAGYFPELIRPEFITSTLSSLGYKIENVPLCATVTTLSQQQAQQYNKQLQLFYKVYTHNSNAYVNYVDTGVPPMYYTFKTYLEKHEYNSAVALVNKLYPFNVMAEASTIHWQIPFPIGM
jgi:hypothetical protein